MMFTLMDSRSIKPVLEVQLPHSIQTEQNETCDCVNLKDYDIQLEPDSSIVGISRSRRTLNRTLEIWSLVD